MSVQVWLPLCGNIQNQGLMDITTSALGTVAYNAGGKIGSAFRAGGTSQVTNGVSINNNFLEMLSNKTATVAVWVKPLGNHFHYNGTIFSSGDWNKKRWAFGVSQNNSQVDVFCNSHNTYVTCAVPVNEWTHLVSVYNNRVCTLYKNGEYVTTYTASADFDSDATNSCVGRETYANGYFGFNGLINDFRLYDHCLSQAEIHELAKGKMIHLKLANNGFGNPNLITRSTFTSAPWAAAITGTETYKGKDAITVRNRTLYTQTSNGTTSIFPAITFAADTQYTLSLDWCDHLRSDGLNSSLYLRFKYSDGTYSNVISPTSNPDANWTHVKLTSTAGKTVAMMTTTYGNGGVVSIANLKLEVGAQETAYSPPTDELDNVEYDCSGYRHDATKNAITPVFDSARYGAAAVFNGSSSYVKINDNTWMADRMPAMTINLWAKVASSWPAAARIFSCTESGGFNCEAGNSGYWRFPVHVYTSATEASVAYKSDSNEIKLSDLPVGEWVMLTWIYDLTGTKTYINGNLHHTYTNTSYGIHFNTGARLFLGCEANAANPSSPYFNGQLSDFRLYATALSEEDIKILYHTSGFVDNQGNVFAGELREV